MSDRSDVPPPAGPHGDHEPLRRVVGRRQVLTSIVATGVLVAVERAVPGAGLPSRIAAALAQTGTSGSFTVSFDFVSGVATVTGSTSLPGGVPVTVTVEALLNGAPMPPGGDAAVASAVTQTAADGSFAAAPTFNGATNDNANQFRLSVTTGSASGQCAAGSLVTPDPPAGPPGPTGPTGPVGLQGQAGPTGPTGAALLLGALGSTSSEQAGCSTRSRPHRHLCPVPPPDPRVRSARRAPLARSVYSAQRVRPARSGPS